MIRLLLFTLLVFSFQKAHADPLLQPNNYCVLPDGRSTYSLFQNLTGIALYVDVDDKYEEALACLGKEEDCADARHITDANKRALFIKRTKEANEAYRAPLRKDKLIELVTKEINEHMLSRAKLSENCIKPPLIILKNKGELKNALGPDNKNILSVVVTLKVMGRIEPKVAMLKVDYYRPSSEHMDWYEQTHKGLETAVPLTASDEQIAEVIRMDVIRYINITTFEDHE